MSKTIMRIAGAAVMAAAILCGAQISFAQRVGPDTIALFPKNVGEFAYANLKQARAREMVSAVAGTDAAGAVQAIRKVSGVGGRRSEYAGGRAGMGIDRRRRDGEDRGNGIDGGADGRRDCRGGAGKLQPEFNGSVLQGAEAAVVQVARIHDVRVWKRNRSERSIFSVSGFEHRGVRASQRTGTDAGRAVRRRGRIAAK